MVKSRHRVQVTIGEKHLVNLYIYLLSSYNTNPSYMGSSSGAPQNQSYPPPHPQAYGQPGGQSGQYGQPQYHAAPYQPPQQNYSPQYQPPPQQAYGQSNPYGVSLSNKYYRNDTFTFL